VLGQGLWDNETGDQLWTTPENWDNNMVPTVDDDVSIGLINQPDWCIIPAGAGELFCNGFTVSARGGVPSLTIEAGAMLNVYDRLSFLGGSWWADADGQVIVDGGSYVMRNPDPDLWQEVWVGYRALGRLEMRAGSLLECEAFMPARGDDCPCQPDCAARMPGHCYVHLDGGLIDVADEFLLRIGASICGAGPWVSYGDISNGWIDITGGQMQIGVDLADRVNGYVDDGWITAYGVGTMEDGNIVSHERACVLVDYNYRNPDKTTVTAYRATAGEAYDLYPAPYAQNVDPAVVLSWKPGDYTAYGGNGAKLGNGHHVFFGAVSNPNIGPNPNFDVTYPVGTSYGHVAGAQDANLLDIGPLMPGGTLELDTEYVWQVIEVNDANGATLPSLWRMKSLLQKFRTVSGAPFGASPADGSTVGIGVGKALEVTLSWSAGYYAAASNGHDVYVSTDFNDVNLALPAAYMGNVSDPCYTVSGVELGTTYYWRVNELNPAGPDPCNWNGPVWSFTVGDWRVVDDFDDDAEDADLWMRWKINAYYGDYLASCSEVGGGAWVTHGPGVMEYTYDNNDYCYDDISQGWVCSGLDYFSEARYEYATAADWTFGDSETTLRALGLDFQGATDNATDPNYDRMYVGVEDSAGNLVIVEHPDPEIQASAVWGTFNIDLREFSDGGVDLTSVKYLYIGFGVRCNSNFGTPGEEGTVTFDNIRLYPTRCVGEPGYRQNGDLNGDCVVDWRDVKAMAASWLLVDRLAGAPVPPSTDGLLAQWEFEEGMGQEAGDSSGNGKVGMLGSTAGADANDPTWVNDAERGWCLYFDGGDYVDCGDNDSNVCGENYFDMPGKSYTVMCWVNQETYLVWALLVGKGEVAWKLQFGFQWLMRRIHWQPGVDRTNGALYNGLVSNAVLDDGRWYHVAATYDADANWATLYVNGKYDVRANEEAFNPWSETYRCEYNPDTDYMARLLIGASDYSGLVIPNSRDLGPDAAVVYPFQGMIDDVRVYDRELSEEEISYVAGKTVANYYPIRPPAAYANLYTAEPQGQQIINLKDFSVLALEWLEADLWPLGY
jgi:hypothetical protein